MRQTWLTWRGVTGTMSQLEIAPSQLPEQRDSLRLDQPVGRIAADQVAYSADDLVPAQFLEHRLRGRRIVQRQPADDSRDVRGLRGVVEQVLVLGRLVE